MRTAMECYRWLMAGGASGDPFDRHLFACAIALASSEPDRPLAVGLGLSAESLAALVGHYFPHAPGLLAGLDPDEDGTQPAAAEEADLRALLMAHGSQGEVEEEWLAHIIARRSLKPHHLWQDLGLTARADLGVLMARHFAPLAAKNGRDMRWKKFLYRQLCQSDGAFVCKSPVCEECDEFQACYGAEDGTSILSSLSPPVNTLAGA